MPINNQDLNQEQLLKEVTSFLDKSEISYMITGSVSVIFYARPRTSHDIDFIIEAKEEDMPKIQKAFSTLPENFIKDVDFIPEAIKHKGSFNLLHLPTYLKIDFWILKDNEFDKERFRRRKKIKVFGRHMYFATPEDTILKKLLWYQESKIEKHLIDAAFVYQIQKNNLDQKYLNFWVMKHKTAKLLDEIKKIDLENHY